MHLNELREKSIGELTQLATEMNIDNPGALKKHEVIFAILKARAKNNEEIFNWYTKTFIVVKYLIYGHKFCFSIIIVPVLLFFISADKVDTVPTGLTCSLMLEYVSPLL